MAIEMTTTASALELLASAAASEPGAANRPTAFDTLLAQQDEAQEDETQDAVLLVDLAPIALLRPERRVDPVVEEAEELSSTSVAHASARQTPMQLDQVRGDGRAEPNDRPARRAVELPAWMKPTLDAMRTVTQGAIEARVECVHPTLGALHLSVSVATERYDVEIILPSEAARQSIQMDLDHLHATFAAAGLKLGRVKFQIRMNKPEGARHGHRRHQPHNE